MLQDIFSTIAVTDIIRGHRIRNVSLFEAVTRFAMDNVGSLVSTACNPKLSCRIRWSRWKTLHIET